MVAEARFADEDLRLFDRLSDGYLHDAAGRSLRAAVGRLNPARTKEPGNRRALFASPTETGCDRFLDRLAQLLHHCRLDLTDALGRDALLLRPSLQAAIGRASCRERLRM